MTLQQLIDYYVAWLKNEVSLGESAPRTLDYYQHWLQRFADRIGGQRPVLELKRLDLESYKSGWHSVQTVQRLFNWAIQMDLLERSPFAKVKRPPLGERTRILTIEEEASMRAKSTTPLLDVLDFMACTICRPQEARTVDWRHWSDRSQCFLLTEFKGKKRRSDGMKQRALIPCAIFLPRLKELREWAAQIQGVASPAGPVLLNEQGQAWTSNALRIAVRRACRRAGLDVGDERIVPYTWRHTAATHATANGIRDRTLAELMGHTDARMTSRYQHLQLDHLRAAIEQATRRPDRREQA